MFKIKFHVINTAAQTHLIFIKVGTSLLKKKHTLTKETAVHREYMMSIPK